MARVLKRKRLIRPRQTTIQQMRTEALVLNPVKRVHYKWIRQRFISPDKLSPPFESHGLTDPDKEKCYRNCLIQGFFHVPVFINWLECYHLLACDESEESDHTTKEEKRLRTGQQKCLACALAKLSKAYWNRQSSSSRRLRALNSFERALISNYWRNPGQQDPTELWRHMYNVIHRQVGVESFQFESLVTWLKRSSFKCELCDHYNAFTEINLIFIVYLPEKKKVHNLSDLVRSGFEDYAQNRTCRKCEIEWSRTLHPEIEGAPELLLVHIQRLHYNSRKLQYVKLVDRVLYKPILDLSPYYTPGTEGRKGLQYRLKAVTCFRGKDDDGHYITIAQGPQGKWTWLDVPQSCEEATEAHALNPQKHPRGERFDPILLFYERVNETERRDENRKRKASVSYLGEAPVTRAKRGTPQSQSASPKEKARQQSARKTPPRAAKTPSKSSAPVLKLRGHH